MPRRIYYINWLDPETGFLKRDEYTSHRDQTARIEELRRRGVTRITEGSFEETTPGET